MCQIAAKLQAVAPLAQLDRASDFESEGRRFESYGARYLEPLERGSRKFRTVERRAKIRGALGPRRLNACGGRRRAGAWRRADGECSGGRSGTRRSLGTVRRGKSHRDSERTSKRAGSLEDELGFQLEPDRARFSEIHSGECFQKHAPCIIFTKSTPSAVTAARASAAVTAKSTSACSRPERQG